LVSQSVPVFVLRDLSNNATGQKADNVKTTVNILPNIGALCPG
jgi:hypothetical protein